MNLPESSVIMPSSILSKGLRPLRAAVSIVAAAVVAACAVPTVPTPREAPATPAAFKEAEGRWVAVAPADAAPRGVWWKAFGDATLDALVERAGRDSAQLQLAAARLAEARALVRQAESARWPQVGVGAAVQRQAVPAATGQPAGTSTLAQLGASVAYEPDLFGRIAGASRAASLDASAAAALVESTRLAVQTETAQAYFLLRAADAERHLVRQSVAAYRDTLRVTERRREAGDVGELDLARVRAEAAATESQALAIDRRRAALEHALALLVGEAPSTFSLEPGEQDDWQGTPPLVPPGVPSAALARRPDVTAARQAMQAEAERLGIARTAWFPDVSLTASGGVASADLGELLRWSARSWGIGLVLSLPVFDGGRRAANVEAAGARWDAAAARHRETVLVALREVEDQLSALRTLAQQATVQEEAVRAATRATVLSTTRWRNGYVSQLELLDARRVELANRRLALQVRADRHVATVGLIRALGGGWSASPAGLGE